MMPWLRQSTAVTGILGPFLDSTDGDTEENALTITSGDVYLSKNGNWFLPKSSTSSCTSGGLGFYRNPLDTTDTDTLGSLKVAVHESGALSVYEDYTVLPANVYDSFVAGTDALDVSLIQILGVEQSATDLKDFADTGYDPSTHKVAGVVLVDTTTTNTDVTALSGAVALLETEADALSRYTELSGGIAPLSGGVAALETEADALARYTTLSGFTSQLPTRMPGVLQVESDALDRFTSVSGWVSDLPTNVPGVLETEADALARYTELSGGIASVDSAAIADAVLDEALSGHATSGTVGRAIADIDGNTATSGVAQKGVAP